MQTACVENVRIVKIANIKKEYDLSPDTTKSKYPELFYYFDGLVNTAISQSQHPAGIIASPITLDDNYGVFYNKDNQKSDNEES